MVIVNNKCALTEYERKTTTKNVTRRDISTSGGSFPPVRPKIGTTNSKCIQKIYDHNNNGIAIDKRYMMTNALQFPSVLVERAFPRHISHINTRPNSGNATMSINR